MNINFAERPDFVASMPSLKKNTIFLYQPIVKEGTVGKKDGK
jgi:hypothetical protein